MDQELTAKDLNSRLCAIYKNCVDVTNETGLGIDIITQITDFSGKLHSHLKIDDYVYVLTEDYGLTLNYWPLQDGKSSDKDDWQYDINIGQVESFKKPPKPKKKPNSTPTKVYQGLLQTSLAYAETVEIASKK